ncbi:hypothetical protein BCEP4_470017 [Burkholderia cepacia]|nr:hypothetical protein BCEP4_470017 [Burkholderia cepacia]
MVCGAARALQAPRAYPRPRRAAGRIDGQGAEAQAARAGLTQAGRCAPEPAQRNVR